MSACRVRAWRSNLLSSAPKPQPDRCENMTPHCNLRPPSALIALVALLTTAPAGAQQPSQAQISAIRSSCASDYRAHCASVPTGGMAALNCLRQNVEKLSAACQGAVNAVGAGAAPSAAPAATPSVAPSASPTEAAPAVPAAPAAPAPAARSFRPMTPRQEIAVLRGACGPDYRALCAGVPPGGGRVMACFRENAASLSPACRAVLMAARRR